MFKKADQTKRTISYQEKHTDYLSNKINAVYDYNNKYYNCSKCSCIKWFVRWFFPFFQKLINLCYRKNFIRMYGLEPFKPELTVVIGRNDEFRSKDERLEIEEQLGKIRLLTYDDLIAYGNTRSIILPEQI